MFTQPLTKQALILPNSAQMSLMLFFLCFPTIYDTSLFNMVLFGHFGPYPNQISSFSSACCKQNNSCQCCSYLNLHNLWIFYLIGQKDSADVIRIQTLQQITLDYLSGLNQITWTLRELSQSRTVMMHKTDMAEGEIRGIHSMRDMLLLAPRYRGPHVNTGHRPLGAHSKHEKEQAVFRHKGQPLAES